ncbi:hypothetical protein AGMMS49974_07440 [Deltaproteobacteria bacterium]|nr:hypothetical protein AGMMS49974_07440 [Deltaproteobacteria bacterium]
MAAPRLSGLFRRDVDYPVNSLITAITSSLGVDREWRMDNLGKALLNHGDFRARGFKIGEDCTWP